MRLKIFMIVLLALVFVQSSAAGVIVLNGLTHRYSGNAGETIQGEIILYNPTDAKQRIKFELQDVHYSCEGSRYFTQNTTHPRSSKTWFNGNLTDYELAPKEKFVYQFEIVIPRNQTIKGSYWNILMIEIDKPMRQNKLASTLGVDSKIRYGIGLITQIGQAEQVAIDFEKAVLDTKKEQTKLNLALINTSFFLEEPNVALEIYDMEGKLMLSKNSSRQKLFPESCSKYLFDISNLPNGKYECLIIAESRNEYVGTQMSLTIE